MISTIWLPASAFQVDMGNLPTCYPTLLGNPGHSLSGIAWLGDTVIADPGPANVNVAPDDDGITFIGTPWTPCTRVLVEVKITAGPNYYLHQQQGDTLFLNAWKDGNQDGDFCDTLCNGTAPEWIIQDEIVVPGLWPFSFTDPGISNNGVPYPGIFRFRLTRDPVGPFGFGLYDPTACPDACPGTFAYDSLGEVEDYVWPDMQLAVNLSEFTAVPDDGAVALFWRTASETGNDHFIMERDGIEIQSIPSQGSSATGNSYRFTDNGLRNGQTYSYQLVSVDVNGIRQGLRTINATPTEASATPLEYRLQQNYPNPFNPSTQITFSLKENARVSLSVYDVLGRQVASLVDGQMIHGQHTITFDGTTLPSGLYICRLKTDSFSDEIKMLLLK